MRDSPQVLFIGQQPKQRDKGIDRLAENRDWRSLIPNSRNEPDDSIQVKQKQNSIDSIEPRETANEAGQKIRTSDARQKPKKKIYWVIVKCKIPQRHYRRIPHPNAVKDLKNSKSKEQRVGYGETL